MKSRDQMLIEQFMLRAGQAVPLAPELPSVVVRHLRAKLIFEEAMETIAALGCYLDDDTGQICVAPGCIPDLAAIADGCADTIVVTLGTLSACGIADAELMFEVCANNLSKVGKGSRLREDGKILKPDDWRPPDIERVLAQQGYRGEVIEA